MTNSYPIDLKLGHKLDINKWNHSKWKNPTSDMLTSRDVIMTSSPIWMQKTADVSTFLASNIADMHFPQKSISKHKKWGVNHYQAKICSKVMTVADFVSFDGFWWRHQHYDVTVTSQWPWTAWILHFYKVEDPTKYSTKFCCQRTCYWLFLEGGPNAPPPMSNRLD